MEIEQKPPNRPNFLLIVLMSGATILVILIAAYFLLHGEARHYLRPSPSQHPASELRAPAGPPAQSA
jgi:hypothetical protein